MPDTPTPGQVCYEAYVTARHGYAVLRPWPYLPPARRAAWEVAAQAAITAWWQAHEAVICGDEEEETDG